MSKKRERELFLKYLSNIYLQNPNLPISDDTIYHELSKFVTYKGEQCVTGNDSLLAVQLSLNNIFRYNNKVNTFSYNKGYFWVIENRMSKNDNEFYSDMSNAIKLYIAVDLDSIHKISELLFNFMIKEGIVMQCKIAKEIRNDALVCRVDTKENAKKVIDYLNGLDYKTNIRPNPFLFDNEKISIAMDGNLSYNSTLSKLLCEYLNMKRSSNSLDKVDIIEFGNFVKQQIDNLNSEQQIYFMNLYKINDKYKYKDFIMICKLIYKNIDNTLTLEEIFKYQNVKDVTIETKKKQYSKQEEDKILHVINSLTNYYSVDEIHLIIMSFIQNGNYRLFTRRDDIRKIVMDNFNKEDVKEIISNLGWNAFISASRLTYNKYGEEWLYNAIDKYLKTQEISGFTRDEGARSRLGLIIPRQLLKEVIVNKCFENNKRLNTNELTFLVLEKINELENKKSIKNK